LKSSVRAARLMVRVVWHGLPKPLETPEVLQELKSRMQAGGPIAARQTRQ